MKKAAILFSFIGLNVSAQVLNKHYNQLAIQSQGEDDVIATEKSINIITKVLYNAVPDGYHVTFTKSFIGKTVEDVELETNSLVDRLLKTLHPLNISSKDVVLDVIALDPIFNMNINEPAASTPSGYKVTENITFNIKSISTIAPLSKKCLDFGIYDLINTEAYLKDSKIIYDSLSAKAIELLDMKKKSSTNIGWSFSGGVATFRKNKDVLYPSERYLTSFSKNNRFYQHQVSQNTTIDMKRELDVDNYFNLNLKDADFIFHSDKTEPVIQFYYSLDYTYTLKEPESKTAGNKADSEKVFYILDKNGNLKKIEM